MVTYLEIIRLGDNTATASENSDIVAHTLDGDINTIRYGEEKHLDKPTFSICSRSTIYPPIRGGFG